MQSTWIGVRILHGSTQVLNTFIEVQQSQTFRNIAEKCVALWDDSKNLDNQEYLVLKGPLPFSYHQWCECA